MPVFDDRIDEAARQLTEGAPDAGFKARVLARIEERPRSSRSRAWLLVPAAAAAIVVVAIVMPRQERADIPLADEIRLTPDPTGEVRLKADTTEINTSTTNEIRPKPDANGDVGPRVDATAPAVQRSRATQMMTTLSVEAPVLSLSPPPITVNEIQLAPFEITTIEIDALREPPVIEVDAIAIAPLDSFTLNQ